MKFKSFLKPFFPLLLLTVFSMGAIAKEEPNMKSLNSLVGQDSAWPLITASAAKATTAKDIKIITAPLKNNAEQELIGAQVSTHSYLGAIIYNSGGILVKNGWLRIWGSGSIEVPRAVSTWNKENKIKGYLVVADDVTGGLFAINGGSLGPDLGNVYYFSSQSLEWESLSMPYSRFIEWAFTKKLDTFYSGLYWENWQKDITGLTGEKSISVYPPLFAKGPELKKRSLRAISFKENYLILQHYKQEVQQKTH